MEEASQDNPETKGGEAEKLPEAARRAGLARYYFGRELVLVAGLAEAATEGAADIYALDAEALA